MSVLAVAVGGALGALSRWGLTRAVTERLGPGFPYGTAVVNITGCLLFGLVAGALARRTDLRAELTLLALTGFMGAFTTFSTYAFETVQLIRDGRMLAGVANLGVQTLVGLLLLTAGLWVGSRI